MLRVSLSGASCMLLPRILDSRWCQVLARGSGATLGAPVSFITHIYYARTSKRKYGSLLSAPPEILIPGMSSLLKRLFAPFCLRPPLASIHFSTSPIPFSCWRLVFGVAPLCRDSPTSAPHSLHVRSKGEIYKVCMRDQHLLGLFS